MGAPEDIGGSGKMLSEEPDNELPPQEAYLGQCYCKACTVTCYGEPALQLVCHCKDCQSFFGSYFAMAFYAYDKVYAEGDMIRYARGGGRPVRHSCVHCGTCIM